MYSILDIWTAAARAYATMHTVGTWVKEFEVSPFRCLQLKKFQQAELIRSTRL